jgi:hypothetical protein
MPVEEVNFRRRSSTDTKAGKPNNINKMNKNAVGSNLDTETHDRGVYQDPGIGRLQNGIYGKSRSAAENPRVVGAFPSSRLARRRPDSPRPSVQTGFRRIVFTGDQFGAPAGPSAHVAGVTIENPAALAFRTAEKVCVDPRPVRQRATIWHSHSSRKGMPRVFKKSTKRGSTRRRTMVPICGASTIAVVAFNHGRISGEALPNPCLDLVKGQTVRHAHPQLFDTLMI